MGQSMCVGEYAEKINNSRGISYYGKYIQKAGDGKRKSIQDERVKVLGSASYSEINVIFKKTQHITISNNTNMY